VHKILVIHGVNLNLLGTREPEKYGQQTLTDVNAELEKTAKSLACTVHSVQSNAEHELIEYVQTARTKGYEFIVINPGAYTHTSIALRDAFSAVKIPFIEVHISNIYAREVFRHHSYLSDIAVGVISGLGTQGYSLALVAAARSLGDTLRAQVN